MLRHVQHALGVDATVMFEILVVTCVTAWHTIDRREVPFIGGRIIAQVIPDYNI